MAWQSSFSAHQEHHWSDAEWEEWLAERARQPWQCAFCGSTCRGKAKVCGRCGLPRAAGDKGVSKTSTSNRGSGNSTTVTTDGTKQTGDTCGQRASHSAGIKTLENTLAALPELGPFESTRVHLQKEISEKNKEITESKPLAMRLASCKGAVDRAAAKRAACQGAVERTIREQQAQQRERELGEELASLERQLSEQVSMDKSNAAMAGGNSLDSLQMCMRSVLREMATSSAVQPNMVDEARRHMEQLFMSLTALSQQSQTANHGSRFSVLRMLQVGKQIPIVLGIDANGVVGSVESGSVGAVNTSNESLNGMMLRSMCQAYNLKFVNTFMDGAPTWASSAGCGRRIDFIAVSWSHFEAVTGCWVDRSIDITPGGRGRSLGACCASGLDSGQRFSGGIRLMVALV